ncbi:expressed unknown protein [Seminavis robusta]|uniref:Uncharacterized protein n=1 Tax=Seminavis robusta TaxID=568900 RepID=A0A9N8EJ60_9STRA|nr:expressed unknown protein [Seminavis robusta]|eukprot:Sro1325_g262920.1 n/a (369) ;mRNA; f:17259-18365
MEMTAMFLDFWEIGDVDILTPTGTYSCRCTELTTSIFTVECGLLYFYLGDNLTAEELLWETPSANKELVTFEAKQEGNETVFVPTSGVWLQGVDGDDSSRMLETFEFSNSSLEIASCGAFDALCGFTIFECEICPGGQTISWSGCYDSVTCEDESHGLLIFAILLDDGITIVPYQEPEEAEDETCQTIEDFCADLASIEEAITDSLSNFVVEDGGQVVEPFNCSCTEINPDNVTLDCDAQYAYDEVVVSTEHMIWKRQEGTDYYLPEQVGIEDQLLEDAGTGANYNETYVVAPGQNDVASCNIGGCAALYCLLCPGETSVLTSCPDSPQSCESANSVAFLFQFRDIKLAVEGCEANATALTAAVNKAG